MYLIQFLVIILCLINLSVSVIAFEFTDSLSFPFNQRNLESNDIYLIDVESYSIKDERNRMSINKIKALNNVLYEQCHEFYNLKKINVENIEEGVAITLDMITKRQNFINFFFLDYHNNLYQDSETSDIVYAGYIYSNEQQEPFTFKANNYPVYATNISTDDNNNMLNSDDNWSVEEVEKDFKFAKIMNKIISASNSRDLLDFVTKLSYNDGQPQFRKTCFKTSDNIKQLNTVLVCTNDIDIPYADGYIKTKLKYKNKGTNQCNEKVLLKHNLVAVLAPTPFKTHSEFTLPTIFYDAPDLYPDKSQFPNSINFVNGKLLPDAFMRFINEMGWERVAVISDDAPYSIDFENKLLKHFIKEGIMYNVQRCETKACDFDKAIKTLSAMDARIIIINVDKANIKRIINKILPYKKFTLLYRFWPSNQKYIDAPRSFVITLNSVQIDKSSPSLETYKILEKTYSVLKRMKIRRKKEFYKKFITTVKQYIHNKSTMAYVTDSRRRLLATMEMNSFNVIKVIEHHPITRNIADQKSCLTKTRRFEKPCDEYLSIYFMFVIVMFSSFVLVITCYFHSSSPIQNRYTQF